MIRSKKRLFKSMSIAVVLFGIMFFLLRGPYLSNYIKRIIVPSLENATRERVIIDNAVINLFPFYLQTKGLKLFDKDGNRLLWVTKARVYIDLINLLSKEVMIRKVTLKEPDLTASEDDIKRIIDNVSRSLSTERKADEFRVTLRNINLTDGNIRYTDASGEYILNGSKIYLDMTAKEKSTEFDILMKEGTLRLKDNSSLSGELRGKIRYTGDKIEVTDIRLQSGKSSVNIKGKMSITEDRNIKDGFFSLKTEIYADTLEKFVSLTHEKDRVLSIDGTVRLIPEKKSRLPDLELNLKAESTFYLESLMEALNVEENIKGEVSFKAELSGIYPDLYGKGKGRLKNALLSTLPIDDLTGEITYKNNRLALQNFSATTYGGKLAGRAHILLPHGDYSVTADVSDINSTDFFRFIEWEPGFPEGKINGNFILESKHDTDISVVADLNYLNTIGQKGNVIGRLKTAHSALEFENNILILNNTVLSTSQSDIFLDGQIDFNKDVLSLNIDLKSEDATDLTEPYYRKLAAPVDFKGKMEGNLSDPEINGHLEAGSGKLHEIILSSAGTDFKYKKDRLAVDRMTINSESSEYNITGSIDFKGAESLFSFDNPSFNANASIKNADIQPVITAAYGDIPVKGYANGTFSFKGDTVTYKANGDMVLMNTDIYGQKLDRVEVIATVDENGVEFKSLTAYKNSSKADAKGHLAFDKTYSLTATSKNINSEDLFMFQGYPLAGNFSIDIAGKGRIDSPAAEFFVNVNDSSYKKLKTGKATLVGKLQGKRLEASGILLNGMVNAKAAADLSGDISWNANLNFRQDRYDFLFAKIIEEEVPEDSSLYMKGAVRLEGRGTKFLMNSRIESLDLTLYGYTIRNKGDVVFEMEDNKFSIVSLSLTGENANFTAAGSLKIRESFDMKLNGNINIAPVRLLARKYVTSLKGTSDFTVNMNGAWNNPEFTGKIDMKNVSAAFRGYPYKIGPANGVLFLNKDSVSFDSIKTDFSGGTVVLSGTGFFEGLTIKRLFVTTDLTDVRFRPSEGVNTLLDGKLFIENTEDGSSLSGKLKVKRARYDKKIDIGSWVLGLREIREAGTSYPEFIEKTELNIKIEGTENIMIENNIARTPVKVYVTVLGTPVRYGLIGRIEADEGTVFFRSNEFKILKGSNVEFVEAGTVAPVFHISAETFAGSYYIRLLIDGTMDDFTLSLFSDPPLSEVDILTLLTFGQVSKDVKGFEGGLAAREATSFLAGGLQESLTEEFRIITGFERFDIEPHTAASGAIGSKVTVGKRFLEDKLFVIYSTSVGTAEESIFELKYNLNKNVSIIGSRNEIGSAGVDLKYRFEFK